MPHSLPQTLAPPPLSKEERLAAIDYVHDLKGLYRHLTYFVTLNACLVLFNSVINPATFWAKWVICGWGIALFTHALATLEPVNIFTRGWENRAARKRLLRMGGR